MIFLDLEDLIHVARRTLDSKPAVRDHGLLQSALARPQASAFGHDVYSTLEEFEPNRAACAARLQDSTGLLPDVMPSFSTHVRGQEKFVISAVSS